MTYLLDVNVLIALIDPVHVGHNAAHAWFLGTGAESWATCPITENGLLRIVGNPRYPNSVGSPAACAPILAGLVGLPGHVFWADAISLGDHGLVDARLITTPGQVTDSYLLALAVSNGGKLATLDRRLSTRAVRGGRAGLCLIDGAFNDPAPGQDNKSLGLVGSLDDFNGDAPRHPPPANPARNTTPC